MSTHVFVDEAKNRGYLIAAAFFRTDQIQSARKRMECLRMPGQRRLYFT